LSWGGKGVNGEFTVNTLPVELYTSNQILGKKRKEPGGKNADLSVSIQVQMFPLCADKTRKEKQKKNILGGYNSGKLVTYHNEIS